MELGARFNGYDWILTGLQHTINIQYCTIFNQTFQLPGCWSIFSFIWYSQEGSWGVTSWSFGARYSTPWGTSESVNGHPDLTIQVLPEFVVYCLISFDVVWCSFVHSCAILIFMADFFDQNPSCWHVSPPGSYFSWAWGGIGKEVGCSGDDFHSQGLHVTTSICGGCGVVLLFLFCAWLTGSWMLLYTVYIFIFVYMYIKYTSLGWSVGLLPASLVLFLFFSFFCCCRCSFDCGCGCGCGCCCRCGCCCCCRC